MPEDLIVRLGIDSTGAKQGAQQFGQAMQGATSSVNEVVTANKKAEQSLNTVVQQFVKSGKTWQEYAKSLKETASAQNTASAAITAQVPKLGQYDTAIKSVIKNQNDLNEATARLNELGKVSHAAYTPESISAWMEQKAAIDDAADSLEDFNDKTDETAEKTANVSRSVITLGASAASTAAQLAGAGGMAPAIQEVGQAYNAIKTTMAAGGSALFAGLTAGVSVALAVITSVITAIKNAKEEAQKQFQAIQQQAIDYTQGRAEQTHEIEQLKQYRTVLNDASASLEETKRAREGIVSQFPGLIAGHTSEGDAIIRSNDAIEEHIELLEKQQQVSREDVLRGADIKIEQMAENYKELTVKMAENRQEADRLGAVLAGDMGQQNVSERITSEWGLGKAMQGTIVDTETMKQRVMELDSQWREMRDNVDEVLAIAPATAQAAIDQYVASLSGIDEIEKALISNNLDRYIEGITTALKNQTMSTEDVSKFLASMTKLYTETALEEEAAIVKRNAAIAQSLDKYGDLTNVTNALAQANKANAAAMDAKKLQAYIDVIKGGKTGTDEYKAAMAALQKEFASFAGDIPGSISEIERLNGAQIEAANVMRTNLANAIRDVIIPELRNLGAAAADTINMLMMLEASLRTVAVATPVAPTRSTSGGGAKQKSAWELELEMIERVQSGMEKAGDQYIAVLEKMLDNHKLSAKERRRVETELAYAMEANAETLGDTYIQYLERILAKQKLTADQRIQIEQKLVDALVAEQDRLQAKYTETQAKQISEYEDLGQGVVAALRNQYQGMAAESAAAYDRQISQLQAASEAQKQAIQANANFAAAEANRAIAQLDAQIKNVDNRIKAYNNEIDAINDQIKAIDNLRKARDRAEKEADDQAVLARLKKQLGLEKDVYDQQQLAQQIAQKEAEITKRKEDEALDDQKARLQDRISGVRDQIAAARDEQAQIRETISYYREQASAARELAQQQAAALAEATQASVQNLQARRDAEQRYWEERTAQDALETEALLFLQESTQEEILALLEKYNPEYMKASERLGKAIYDSIADKAKNTVQAVKKAMDDVTAQVKRAMEQLAALQQQAAGMNISGGRVYASNTAISTASAVSPFAASMFDASDFIQSAAQSSLMAMMDPVYAYRATQTQNVQPTSSAGSYGQVKAGLATDITVNILQPIESQYDIQKATRKGLIEAWNRM